MTIELKEAVDTWKAPLEKVFQTVSGQTKAKAVQEQLFNTDSIHICSHKIGQPTVFIPVFPGTNCEYDSAKAFELGICNGFQALIKLGLVPYGKVCGQTAASPTLTYNTIGRHISKMVYTKVVTNKSLWLQGAELGGVYTNPASHGEGRFVASEEVLNELFANGQVATQYCDLNGTITMDEEWNPNGSYRAIEGITSPDGRVLGKMAHSERRGDSVAINIYGEQDLQIFESGVKYFK